MINELTSSLEISCNKRLENFYNDSNVWLSQVSYNITKHKEESNDLVADLWEYLIKKCHPKLYWKDSYNRMYAMAFLKHRWINKVKKLNRVMYVGEVVHDDPFEEYDYELDESVDKAHNEVMSEIKRLQRTRMWTSAKLYEMYWCDSDDTLQQLADKIGISKSTVFIAIKKVRKHLEKVINNPFQ
jgi:DNA-directed RNA polymerase specialized sigma24 family protein